MARRVDASLPEREGRRPAHWYRSPSGSLRPAGSDGVLFAPVRSDLGVDFGARQAVEPASLGAAPGFLEPVGRRRGGADEILHAQDDDGRLPAPVDDEALVVLGGEVHDLSELGAGNVGVDAAIHSVSMN